MTPIGVQSKAIRSSLFIQIRKLITRFVGRLGMGCIIIRYFDSGKDTRKITNESTKTITLKNCAVIISELDFVPQQKPILFRALHQ